MAQGSGTRIGTRNGAVAGSLPLQHRQSISHRFEARRSRTASRASGAHLRGAGNAILDRQGRGIFKVTIGPDGPLSRGPEFALPQSRQSVALRVCILEVAVVEPDRKPEPGVGVAPKVVLVAGVDEPAFGRIQFDALTFFADKLVLDCLEVTPIPKDRPSVSPTDVELHERRLGKDSARHVIQVVPPIGRIPRLFVEGSPRRAGA